MYTASYRTQLEGLKAKLEAKDSTQVHFLTLQTNGSFLDTQTKTVYKDWNEVEKGLTGTIIIDDIVDVEQEEGDDIYEDNG